MKPQSAPETTEEELSEVGSTRSRPRSRRTVVKPASKARTRSSTASSTQTSVPARPDAAKKPEKKKSVPDRLRSSVATTAEQGTKTPTRSSFLDVTNDDHSAPEASPPPKSKDTTERTRVVSALGTSDSDTDFQSAYSASPRESYANFENGKQQPESDDEAAMVLRSVPENHEDRFSAVPKTRRERVSSTATAILKRDKSEPRATNPLPPRNRIPSKQT
jgi:hypothetical protein